jgi:hypothetical protein
MDNNHAIQTERSGFLKWLGGQIGAYPLTLNGRSEFRRYESIGWDRFLSLLKRNKGLLKVDPASRTIQENLEAEYKLSVARIQPITLTNERLDGAIDEAVFAVYGLAETQRRSIERSTQLDTDISGPTPKHSESI